MRTDRGSRLTFARHFLDDDAVDTLTAKGSREIPEHREDPSAREQRARTRPAGHHPPSVVGRCRCCRWTRCHLDAAAGQLRNVLADPAPRNGRLSDIKHVVLLMQENRSFDHYFGTLSGVRGFDDRHALRSPTGRSVFYQPYDANPDGYLLPYHLDSRNTAAQAIKSMSHEWRVQHQAWNGGRMDNWLPAHLAADGAKGPFTMGYFNRQDIPFHYALADAFTICDSYHCSVLGPTHPNRYMYISVTIDPDGEFGGPALDNGAATGTYSWTTYPERLVEAGVSWRIYHDPMTTLTVHRSACRRSPR